MKIDETGRSMVEMLGVLAIIGVLSIGGIAGYTSAMSRYRANEILDLATKYATILYTGKESYKVRHNGNGDGYVAPTYEQTDLAALPGAKITTQQDRLNGYILPDRVQFVISFEGNKSVCKAMASTLGYGKRTTQTDNKGDQHYGSGTADCDVDAPSIFFVSKQKCKLKTELQR